MQQVKCPAIAYGRTKWNEDPLLVCGVECPLGFRESYTNEHGRIIHYCSQEGLLHKKLDEETEKRLIAIANNVLIFPSRDERPIDRKVYETPAQVINFAR